VQGITDPTTLEFIQRQQRADYWGRLSQWGYDAWYVGFALAALLLLLYVLIPRESYDTEAQPQKGLMRFSRYRALLLHLGAVLLLILCAVSHQTQVDQTRGFAADRDKRYEATIKRIAGDNKEESLKAQYMYLPTGNSLIYMSLGNPGIAADYMWLTSQQYVVNSQRRGQKYEMLLRFYNTVMELDPHWVEVAVNGGKVLSALEPNRYSVEKFYQSAIFNNPGNTELPYEAGRLFVVPPLNLEQRKDFAKHATDWFSLVIDLLNKEPQTSDRDKRIKTVRDLIARMAVETDAYEVASEVLWEDMHNPEISKALRQIYARDWLNARSLVIVSKLQKEVDDYRALRFFAPFSIAGFVERLKNEKNLFLDFDRSGMPKDAFGFAIKYNPVTGKVASHGVQAKLAIQAGAIVNSLIATTYMQYHSDPPPNLNELQVFIDKFFAIQGNEPTAAITNAIGMDLNVTTSPFGTPWIYSPATGKVELPPECNPKVLFRNAEKLVPAE
jgi:hypothetical protein